MVPSIHPPMYLPGAWSLVQQSNLNRDTQILCQGISEEKELPGQIELIHEMHTGSFPELPSAGHIQIPIEPFRSHQEGCQAT